MDSLNSYLWTLNSLDPYRHCGAQRQVQASAPMAAACAPSAAAWMPGAAFLPEFQRVYILPI